MFKGDDQSEKESDNEFIPNEDFQAGSLISDSELDEAPIIEDINPVAEELDSDESEIDKTVSGNNKATTDINEIRKWADERNGMPAKVINSRTDDPEILRIKFEEENEKDLEEITWDDFQSEFERNNLGLVYQERTKSGDLSRFHKFISRDVIEF